MPSHQKGKSQSFLVLASVFVTGAGISAVLLFGLSRFDRDNERVVNTSIPSGDSEGAQDISASESDRSEAIFENPVQTRTFKLEEIVQLDGPLERITALHSVLAQADEDQVLDMLETSKHLDPPTRVQTQVIILQRLARINPRSAFAQAKQFDRPRVLQLLTGLFREWSQIDLDEAVAHAATLTGSRKLAALEGILEESSDLTDNARRDIARQLNDEQHAINLITQEKISQSIEEPERVWNESVLEAKHDPKLAEMLKEIALNWVKKDGLDAMDHIIESLDNSLTRSLISTVVLREVAKTDPSAALEFAMTLEYDPFHETQYAVVDEWAISDPQLAFDSISLMDDTGRRGILMDRLIQTWGSFHPYELFEDLESLPNDFVSKAVYWVMSALASGNAEDAAKIVTVIDDDSLKISATQRVLQLWSLSDTESALDWVLKEPGLESQRSRLLTYLLVRYVEDNAERAMDLALEQPLEVDEIGLEVWVVAQLASIRGNLDTVLEYLPRVREGETKMEAYRYVGLELVHRNQTDKAMNLVQQIPEEGKSKYLSQIFGSWAISRPIELLESLDQMQSSDYASIAALALLQSDPQGEFLSSNQMETVKTFLTEEDAKRLDE